MMGFGVERVEGEGWLGSSGSRWSSTSSKRHTRRVLEIARPIIGDVPTYPSRDPALEALRGRYTEPALYAPTFRR